MSFIIGLKFSLSLLAYSNNQTITKHNKNKGQQ